jgi:hypothetical protein
MREPPCGGFPWGTRQNWTLTEKWINKSIVVSLSAVII